MKIFCRDYRGNNCYRGEQNRMRVVIWCIVCNEENVDNYGYWRLCLTEVVSVTGITEKDILSRRDEESSDARYILVYFLALRLTDNEIAKVSGMSRQRVNYLKNHFQWVRGKWSVKCKVKEVGDRLDGVEEGI